MGLSKLNKEKMRMLIEEKLSEFPEGKLYKLETWLLEELIFEEINDPNMIIYDGEEIIDFQNHEYKNLLPFRFPVWTGDFLKKLDLSNISFDNVLWNGSYYIKDNESKNEINFAGTNAKIDFSLAKKDKNHSLLLESCCFRGTKLINFESVDRAIECDFSECNLTSDDINSNVQKFDNCNFLNNNFSNTVVEKEDIFDFGGYISFFEFYSNFKNTGLNLCINIKELEDDDKYFLEQLISKGFFDGCYINDFLITEKSHDMFLNKNWIDLRGSYLTMDEAIKIISNI